MFVQLVAGLHLVLALGAHPTKHIRLYPNADAFDNLRTVTVSQKKFDSVSVEMANYDYVSLSRSMQRNERVCKPVLKRKGTISTCTMPINSLEKGTYYLYAKACYWHTRVKLVIK